MKPRLRCILFIFSFMLIQNARAETWISVGIPTVYHFSGNGNSLFLKGTSLSGTPAGYMIHAYLPYLPVLGYEYYEISINSKSSDNATAIVNVVFYDICLYFEQKYTSFLLGFGYGSMEMECEVTSCSSLEFRKGIARQYFAQLGVPLFDKMNVYLSAHSVIGTNKITLAGVNDDLSFDGMLYAFGLKVGW